MFELAPQYAGVSMGLSNTLGSLLGVISPILTGFLVQNKVWFAVTISQCIVENRLVHLQLASEWRMVFYIAAAISLFGAIVFGVFASGVVQPWATKKQGLIEKYQSMTTVGFEILHLLRYCLR